MITILIFLFHNIYTIINTFINIIFYSFLPRVYLESREIYKFQRTFPKMEKAQIAICDITETL